MRMSVLHSTSFSPSPLVVWNGICPQVVFLPMGVLLHRGREISLADEEPKRVSYLDVDVGFANGFLWCRGYVSIPCSRGQVDPAMLHSQDHRRLVKHLKLPLGCVLVNDKVFYCKSVKSHAQYTN